MMARRAIFLDRDGTLVEPRHYPSRPEELHLYENIAPDLHILQRAGFQLVVVTNQSGIARGYFSEADLARMHRHLAALLARQGVQIAGFYHCPHHPDGVMPGLSRRCRCRKPEPGMLFQAADDLGLDPERSWLVGDILDDVEAGNRAGCRTILVDLDTEPAPDRANRRPDFVARSTNHALQLIRSLEGLGTSVDMGYVPRRWDSAAPTAPSWAAAALGQPARK